jgi:hypothetical protein
MENGLQFGLQKTTKKIPKFICEKCHFKCCKLSEWDRHIKTSKHSKDYNLDYNGLQQNAEINITQNPEFICNCGKVYKHRQGLYKHKKNCKFDSVIDNSSQSSDVKYLTSLVLEVVKQNHDLQNKILDICKIGNNNAGKIGNNNAGIITNDTNNSNNNNNINSHNKAFNLNFFLNETCKDAMNISDFIESVKLQVSDLENVGKVGYIEGISNIIIKNLNALDIDKRPVHCTDQKREVMYVKEDNIWEKEEEANTKLRKAIRTIAHKNICMFKEFREKYPDCEEYDSKKNSQYNKIVYEAMGGKGDDDYEKNTKIIKKIAKVVGIEKE